MRPFPVAPVEQCSDVCQETVKGVYVSESMVTCDTPSFEKWGAGDVIIKVQVGGEGFTVHRVR